MATKDYILGNNPPKGSKAWNEKDESVQYPKGTQQWTESASTEDNKDSKQKSTPEKSETDNIRTPLDVVKNNPKFQNVAENAYKKVINPEQQEKSVTKVVSDSENKAQPRYNWRDKPEHDNEVYKTSVHRYGNGEVGYKALQQQAKDNEDQYNHENNAPNSKQQEKKTEKKEQVKSQTPYESISGNQAIQKVAENAYKKVINPEQQEKKVSTYSELLEELYPKPDSERLKEDAKRARTRNVIAALGDGISALANLYYTTKGAPNMLDGKNTLSAKSQARYDKLIQDYKDNFEKYRQGRLKALQLDEDRADKDKQWQRLLGRDQVEDERWNKQWQRILERDKAEDEKFDWQKTEKDEDDERERKKADREYNLKFQSQNKKGNDKEKEVHHFNDGNKEMVIDDKKWKDNYQRLYDELVEEGVIVESRGENPSSDQIETAVKRHWNKSKKVTGQMLSLSDENVGFDEQFEGITIPYNIWENEYEKIFDEMVKDGTVYPDKANLMRQSLINRMSPDEKEQIIRENWDKSPYAKKYIKNLAGIPYSDDNTAPYIRNQNSDDNTAPYIRK